MATKLSIYNGALALLGETPLSSLSEDRPARYWLDRAWDDDLVDYCLEQGQWNWATRTQKMTFSTSIVPAFSSYLYAYQVPDDFKGINSIWIDPFFKCALENYYIETNVIYCDFEVIYLKHISNASTYGGNLALWPQVFADYVQTRLANKVEPNITNSTNMSAKMERAEIKTLSIAKNNDKRQKPRDVLPLSSWSKSRLGYGGSYYGANFGGNGY